MDVLKGKGYDKSADWWSAGVILFEMVFGFPTFSSSTTASTKKKIMDFERYLVFPTEPLAGPEVKHLIQGLICDVRTRLGSGLLQVPSKDNRSLFKAMLGKGDAGDIKSHAWFAGFDWEGIQDATPPFIPILQEKTDTSYFEKIDQEHVETMMNFDEKNCDAVAIDGFTYRLKGVMDS